MSGPTRLPGVGATPTQVSIFCVSLEPGITAIIEGSKATPTRGSAAPLADNDMMAQERMRQEQEQQMMIQQEQQMMLGIALQITKDF